MPVKKSEPAMYKVQRAVKATPMARLLNKILWWQLKERGARYTLDQALIAVPSFGFSRAFPT
jgi:hypothetical protein